MMIKNNLKNTLEIEPPKKYFTTQDKRVHVRTYQSSNESMIAYCDKHQLALSTFKSWVKKYGEKKMPAAFVPILASKHTSADIKSIKSLQRVEIYAGDIKVIFPELSDTEMLITLIRGISHANPVKSTGNIIL